MPLVINCWPTQTGGDAWEVNVEYELSSAYPKLEVRSLVVHIPCPVDVVTSIVASSGQAAFSKREQALRWVVQRWAVRDQTRT